MSLKQSTRPLNIPVSEIERAYLAGLFDADGSVVTKHHKGRQYGHITITNCDEPLIQWLGSLGGGITVSTHPRTDTRTCYSWYVSKSGEVVLFLEALMPYLIVKRERALTLIATLNTLPSRQGVRHAA